MKSHILLIDKEKPVIRAFTDTFIQHDYPYKCTCADDVRHARQIIDFLVPDFIFINLDNNVGDVLEFISALKKVHAFKQIKIISYSKNFAYYQCVSKAYGSHLCIAPPLTAGIIYEAINSLNIPTLAKG